MLCWILKKDVKKKDDVKKDDISGIAKAFQVGKVPTQEPYWGLGRFQVKYRVSQKFTPLFEALYLQDYNA